MALSQTRLSADCMERQQCSYGSASKLEALAQYDATSGDMTTQPRNLQRRSVNYYGETIAALTPPPPTPPHPTPNPSPVILSSFGGTDNPQRSFSKDTHLNGNTVPGHDVCILTPCMQLMCSHVLQRYIYIFFFFSKELQLTSRHVGKAEGSSP